MDNGDTKESVKTSFHRDECLFYYCTAEEELFKDRVY